MQGTAIAPGAPGFAHAAAAADLLGQALSERQGARARRRRSVAERRLVGHGFVRWGEKRRVLLTHRCNQRENGRSLGAILTDAVAPVGVQQEAWFARAPVASFGVEAFGVLTEPRQQALVDVCGGWSTSVVSSQCRDDARLLQIRPSIDRNKTCVQKPPVTRGNFQVLRLCGRKDER